MSSSVHPGPGCNCSECNPLRAYTDMSARLAEATALLERCRNGFDWNQYDDPEQNETGRMLAAFLSRAPAQPAAPDPRAYGARVPEHMRGHVVPEPAAPEPSVDLDERDTFLSGHVASLKLRAESAESKLAAVREAWDQLAIGWRAAGSEYLLKDFRIVALDTLLRPTPGTGGEGGER